MPIKKKFFEVEIPLTNSSVELFAYNLESLANKTIKLDLTRQLRGKSIEVVFQVKIENNKAVAEPIKLTLLPFFIRRMIRRSISYVEDSFSAECEDAQLKIKPFFITRKKVHREIRKALREEARDLLTSYIKNKPAKEIFSDIIGNRLQKPLSLKLKKIYPLALCEIRVLKIEKLKEQEKLKISIEKIKGKEEREKTETKDEKAEEKTEIKEKVEKAEEAKEIEKEEKEEEIEKEKEEKTEKKKD